MSSQSIYISQARAAEILQVSEVTLWRWLKVGAIKPQALVDGKVPVFEPSYLELFAQNRKSRPSSAA